MIRLVGRQSLPEPAPLINILKEVVNVGMYNRYYIAKKKHQEYLIIIIRREKCVSCGIDALILKHLKKNVNIEHQLQELHINYLMLDNLDIISKYSDENNQYNKYFY